MRVLLDTHLLLWAAFDSKRVPAAAAALISEEANVLLFSAASIAEIANKSARGKPDFAVDARVMRRLLIDHGYEELAVTSLHAAAIGDLPAIHGDPFDRMLVAQAVAEGVMLVTGDALLGRYSGVVRVV